MKKKNNGKKKVIITSIILVLLMVGIGFSFIPPLFQTYILQGKSCSYIYNKE